MKTEAKVDGQSKFALETEGLSEVTGWKYRPNIYVGKDAVKESDNMKDRKRKRDRGCLFTDAIFLLCVLLLPFVKSILQLHFKFIFNYKLSCSNRSG